MLGRSNFGQETILYNVLQVQTNLYLQHFVNSIGMKIILFVLLSAVSLSTFAQSFITHLERRTQNCGVVTISQSKEIEALVNGTTSVPASNQVTATSVQTTQNSEEETVQTTKKLRTSGYRIQVYSGGNSRNARNNAYAVAEKVKRMFPEMNVYTHFASPRWICRAGDFKTYEEANDVLQQMRESGMFTGISIVKDQIVLTL